MRPVRTSAATRRQALVTGAVAALAIPGRVRAETLVLQGSTTFNSTLMAIHQKSIEAASGHTLRVVPNKSNLGLLALLKGEADMAMISTSLDNELTLMRRTEPNLPYDRLTVSQIARTQAALVLHATNPMATISFQDLRRILSGDVFDWREFGLPQLPIRVVAVRDGGGVVATVEAAVLGPGQHISAPNQIRLSNGGQIVQVVEQEPGALGITQASLVPGRKLQRLIPSEPIEQRLDLVTLGPPSPAMQAVIAACRDAAAGVE